MGRAKQTKRGRRQSKKSKKADDDEVEFVCTIQTHEEEHEEERGQRQEQEEEHVEEREPEEKHEEEQQQEEERQPEQHNGDEPEGEIEHTQEAEGGTSRKRKRGPTMMRDLAKDPNTRVHVDFTFMGEAYGPGSVKLSSYLGPLVREHVPVTVENWKKITEEVKTVLWKSVQVTVSKQ